MKHKIKIYSTQHCIWCVRVKEFFKQNKIEFEDVDVNKDKMAALEMIKKSGQMGVPVIDIDDNIIIGFDVEKIKKLLNIK